MKDWRIQGRELANCNCNFGCPCQFGVLPSDGTCEAAVFYQIEKGHYGDVQLDGLMAAGTYKWPGAIHEGQGEMQLIIDARATPEQAAALEAIMTGQDTNEMATMWFVFSAMAPNRHPTLAAPMHVEMDMDERKGRVVVDGVFEIDAVPIPNIVTGDPHRISINLPHGFEFARAEMAKGSTTTMGGAISLAKNSSTHAHFADLHLTGTGVVRA
ncbi:DUF1326 domain-containing protein [Pseudoruegeria sp. SHC-113]|uniref:DUF1326 domain-containing protein n=1 Tax=Pseudoruegeria sp. SHC-113 TaxID=2855439 RepID=UPI0021BACC25|nr:DUF1326 domain-containing protein [Pseudoruegeria sp. SHC-113]MCT8162051.1 DUF1326 domain-containing protein [Pseudoruegeria sp. SHC-113]